ncbi:MAG: hypothetical protein HY819_23685 [Acidobacteria bacterium]|nr:hypothetical protein [Acidobacteriota bacterium]
MSKPIEETDQPSNQTDEANKFFLGARSALKIGDMGAAERLLRKSLDLSPKNYLYMLTLARLLVQMDKNPTESEVLLIESSNLKLDAVEPRLILSAVYEKQGRIRITQSVLKSVINIDPTNFIAKRKLSQLGGEIAQDQDPIKLRKEVIAECIIVDNADLPLITPSTTLIDLKEPLLENHLVDINKTFQSITKEPILSEEPVESPLENAYVGLSQRLAIAELLAVDSEQINLENQNFLNLNNDIQNNIEILQSLETQPPQEIFETENTFQAQEPQHIVDSQFNFLGDFTSNKDIYSNQIEDTVVEVLKLEADYLLAIIRDFFFAVRDQLDETTAFLLLNRARQQIESLYPELDYFEIQEDHRIIEFMSQERFVSKRTLEAITTWMYLLMILLKETSYLRDEAREKALKQAFPQNDDIEEERLFRQYFNEIQL